MGREILLLLLLLAVVSRGLSDNCTSCLFGQNVHCTFRQYTSVPTHCFSSDVTSINLDHNDITELVEHQFSKFTNLRDIHINYNKIKFVHKTAFDGLSKLIALHLEHNEITTFPQIGVMGISIVELKGNKIKEIRREHINGLTSLTHLY
ncbi:asporin-like [Corticium candelabrum]|uniref:asporin-like n=1 Tax=Corticium candelabrum TaxID=121492 RepID=UPI002E2548BB|nr:asporin-like [Corticium candelabrum]